MEGIVLKGFNLEGNVLKGFIPKGILLPAYKSSISHLVGLLIVKRPMISKAIFIFCLRLKRKETLTPFLVRNVEMEV